MNEDENVNNNIVEAKLTNPLNRKTSNIQFELFKQFITNDKNKVSNSIEIWERIPKYFFTTEQIKKLQPEKGQPDPYTWTYEEDGQIFNVEIQPALIKKNGVYKAYFPSYTEELIEEALKKILTIQNLGIHNPNKHETWVRFTLSMINKELRNRGKGRQIAKIKQAIAVMSGCIITVYKNKKEVWKGSILQDLVTVNREEYLEDSDSYHIARLPLFISHAIEYMQTRQFNYDRLMQCNGQLSRWIYRQLINRFKQASFDTSYHFLFKDLKCSGLLQQKRERDNRKKVVEALKELIKQGVLVNYEMNEQKKNRKIIDITYSVYPSKEFVHEQKAANKRAVNDQIKALTSLCITSYLTVDK